MTNDRNNDDTPKNPLVHDDPALEAAGMGAIEMSPDDLMITAAACIGMATALQAQTPCLTPAAEIARLYQIAAAWLRVCGMTGGPVLDYEQRARDVLATAAASDLDRIRTAGAKAH